MSTEIPPTDPTEPTPVPPSHPKVDPDNWHVDGTKETAPEGLLAGKPAKPGEVKPGEVKPDNWHVDSEPAS
jgi:hypothetical protein